MQSLVVGGGCFWCVDAVFRQVEGVTASICGYAGGDTPDPDYRSVCTGLTGHYEVVRLEFDESVIDADTVLDIFFTTHDPTSRDRQGHDAGSQYRSALMYENDEQRELFERAKERAASIWDVPIVTVVEPLKIFYEAEEYHQNYYARNPYTGYCMAVINPKISAARKRYAQYLRAS
ncbi:peptide-methionine (S)-S-oxide reductase MsrA [Rothia sp. ZJ932]|uniref:peptide-methionine (S)-S-oxide reductase MsrA n=1 Tax=Rothia sp. ZJ932 TaxID=2810516 RepID=UPI001966F065|nr:peptide-methionine (S)-S-oxide reductase MsrA [Rothia sp. ZJ932]QRZ62372.1 peptide-methionine (S)-S-oxide reductase MsrA [Rothia sp. ZJ932]